MKTIYIIVSLIFIALGIFCFYFKEAYQEYSDALSIAGSLASIFGIIIAIIQAYQSKTAADAAKEAAYAAKNAADETAEKVKDGMDTVKKAFLITDISAILHLPNEIQDSIQRQEWLRAFEKMRNLKDELVEFSNNPSLEVSDEIKKDLQNKIAELEIRINAFNKGITDNKVAEINPIEIIFFNIMVTLS